MWNLLVVEDEAIVRMGLRYMVDWEAQGVCWKAEASNGEEAVKVLDAEDIHIVMTDIRMPGMDGLDLGRYIREKHGGHIQVIYLSSYDDFPYVKEAIRLGALDYLHKPTMDEKEVTAALHKAIQLLEQSTARAPEKKWSEDERNDWLVSLLDAYTYPKKMLLPELAEGQFNEGLWITAMRLRDDAADHMAAASVRDHLKFMSIRYLIDEYVARDWGGIVFHRNHREILWLAPAKSKEGLEDHQSKEQYLDRLRGKVFELLNASIIYSCSSVYDDFRQIPEAYLEVELKFPVNQQSDSLHVRLAKEYVDNHLLEDITLMKVAESIPISSSYLSRIFLKEVGESFSDYVIRNKVIYAQKLLRETNKKIYEISEILSYTNPHYFSKLFKERTGMTPLEYRNR
ncbi:response regulator transcription factor [Paenibacillus woosongensis]|uniref:Response regulator n=1 Tax=Paenibacillus woosongensis TaxID=307580 RepID=A0A7X2YZ62_9BACL|nr:response regulator [Paenibacillus woosongensis]MUG43886.1 response regulator [Paenibacillus woosongensis]